MNKKSLEACGDSRLHFVEKTVRDFVPAFDIDAVALIVRKRMLAGLDGK